MARTLTPNDKPKDTRPVLQHSDGFPDWLEAQDCSLAVLTRSAAGCVIAEGDEVHVVEARKVDHVADTTGAGDLFAAGFLFGLTQGKPLAQCGRLGALAASEIISHVGARPEASLRDLAAEHGLM